LRNLNFQLKRILILAKAYPVRSLSYGETVCSAGIDLDTFKLIRIYPINYRDLDYKLRFKKYSVIQAECAWDRGDGRPESYRVRQDSISILGHIDTSHNWQKRKQYIQILPIKSLCQIMQEEQTDNISLGLIRPENIDFHYARKKNIKTAKKNLAYAEPGLFDKKKEPIEDIPYQFYYSFKCASAPECNGHRLAILDWEINQAYRKWREQYAEEKELLSKIRDKWLSISDCQKRDVLLFVGNLFRFRKVFVVLSVFYPPKISSQIKT